MIANTLRFLLTHPLTRRQRIATLRRFVAWQVASRVFGGASIVPFVDHTRLIVRRGQHAATGNLYTGLHEFTDMAFTLHALRQDELFLDIGANIGAYTLLASGCVGARTVAFEPVASTYAALQDHVRLNAITHLATAWRLGLAAKDGELRFTRDEDSRNHVLTTHDAVGTPTETVGVRTLDGVLAEHMPAAAPRLLKLDVEGYEGEVLAGAQSTLAGTEPCAIVIETGQGIAYGHRDEAIDAALRTAGFVRARYDAGTRVLENVRAGTTPVPATGPGSGNNAIYLRDLPFFRDRVRAAPRFRVLGTTI